MDFLPVRAFFPAIEPHEPRGATAGSAAPQTGINFPEMGSVTIGDKTIGWGVTNNQGLMIYLLIGAAVLLGLFYISKKHKAEAIM